MIYQLLQFSKIPQAAVTAIFERPIWPWRSLIMSVKMLSARVGLKDWFILCWKNYHFIPNLHNTRKDARVFHRIFVGNLHWSLRYCRTIQNSVLWSNIETLKITLKSDCIYPCAIWKAKEKPIILHHNIFHAVRSVQACIRVGDIHTRF